MEKTLAIIKPHVVKNVVVLNRIKDIINENFHVIHSKDIHITKSLSDQFYAEHKGKFFYYRLSSFMNSGISHALVLESENCIEKWRELIGPTKVYKGTFSHPDSLRALYGLSDTRNGFHGSDSIESAKREISIIFPDYNY